MAKTKRINAQDLITGTDGNDSLVGTAGSDTLVGLAGDDELHGLGGNDLLRGDAGSDVLDGGVGRDTMRGGADDDTYYVDHTGDQVIETSSGGERDEVHSTVSYTLGANVEDLHLEGGADLNGTGNGESNYIVGNAGNNRLEGRGGDDHLRGEDGNDSLYGGAGDDLLQAGSGVNLLNGGAGDDLYFGVDTDDSVVEAADGGHDVIYLNSLIDSYQLAENVEDLEINGAVGVVHGNSDGNYININNADGITVYGHGGDDDLFAWNDATLYGGGGNDSLGGRSFVASQIMYGEAGRDSIELDTEGDIAYGGNGKDTFTFEYHEDIPRSDMVRHVADFDAAAGEQIRFEDFSHLMDSIPIGRVADRYFYAGDGAGAVAQTADHRYIFDRESGALYYDRDGTGASALIQVGQIDVTAGELSASNLYHVDAWA